MGLASRHRPAYRRWLAAAILIGCTQLSGCGASSFACSDEGAALLPALGEHLRSGLATQKNVRIVEVGQCYEGGKDGYQTSFESPSLEHTVGVLERAWVCGESEMPDDLSALLTCKVSNTTVTFEVDHSVDRGEAYASIASSG